MLALDNASNDEHTNILLEIKNGDSKKREDFIKSNWKFIMYTVSKTTGKIAYESEEFSVALLAFNEAIDDYKEDKEAGFLTFASLIIKRRLIDHIRKNKKFQSEFAASSDNLSQELNSYANVEDISQTSIFEEVENVDSIKEFELLLESYKLNFKKLHKVVPKHSDTRLLCAKIAMTISDSDLLSSYLIKEHKLPTQNLTSIFNVSRKTIDNHRKYIIALFLIQKSDLNVLKSYMASFVKGDE